MLVHKYGFFKIEPNEFITKIFTKFTIIINYLKSLGKSYTNSELVRKILKSLPIAWKAKITTILEAKNLDALLLEELLGSLMAHKLTMKLNSEEEVKKKKTISLKFTTKD